jgi:hypothetical protein
VKVDWAETISANGSLFAWQEAIIGAEANGLKITDVRVNVGARGAWSGAGHLAVRHAAGRAGPG